jgi:hypothetical protein
MCGEAQQAASGGCIAASPRRVLAQHSAKRENQQSPMSESQQDTLHAYRSQGTRRMYGMSSGIFLSLFVINDPAL